MTGDIMNMRSNVVAVLLGAWITQGVLANDNLTLDRYIAQVMESNPAIKSSRDRSTAAQFRVQPSAVLDDPFLAAGIDEVPFGEHRAEIFRYQVSQTFPFPGKLGARKEIARSNAVEASQSAETLRRELAVVATQLFFKAYYMDEAIMLNRDLYRLVDTSVQSTKAKYQSGGAEHHEWLLGTIELANLDVEHARLVRERSSLGVQLNELRGIAATEMHERIVAQFSSEPNVDDAGDFTDQPEIKALDAQINKAESEYRMSKLAAYPDFVVQVMAMEPNGDGMDEESGNWGVMVGVNLPLYYSLKQSKLARAANAEKHAAEMDRLYLLNKLKTEVFASRQQFTSAKDVVRLYEQKVMPATELALANAQTAYAAQRVDLQKYLDVLKVYKTQRLELVAARADIELARTRMRELLSSPPLMRLAPGRPTLFGGTGMGGGMEGSAPVSMGGGMSNPNVAKKNAASAESAGSAGMSGM